MLSVCILCFKLYLHFKIYKMVEIGRDLWRSSCNPLAQAGPARAQDDVQMAFECLQEWRLQNLLAT